MRSLAFLGLTAALSAQTIVYDNGPFQTAATGGGAGGTSPVSVLQNVAPLSHTVFGYGAQQAAANGGNKLTDNFTVANVMLIDQIRVYGYATGATAPSSTGCYLAIYDGDPAVGTPNQLLVGAGTQVGAPNLQTAPPAGYSFISNTFTGIYRVLPTLTDTSRNVQQVTIGIPTLTLTPGTYWIEFMFNGINFVPPLTTTDVGGTGDAKQKVGAGAYLNILNGAFGAGLPFTFLSNTPAATPGSITNLGGGCTAATFRVEGAPTVGGYVRATLGNVGAAYLGVIVVGFSDPATPLFVCPCTSHASLDVLNPYFAPPSAFELQVPLVASLAGAALYFQGAQLDLFAAGGLACNLGVPFELTDGFRYQLNLN